MLPRDVDLTVNKYLSRDNNVRARYLWNGPNHVPWKEGPALLSRAGFFNAIEKKQHIKIGIQFIKYDNDFSVWYNDIDDISFTIGTASTNSSTFNVTLPSFNGNITRSSTSYYITSYDDYGISSNKLSKYEDVDNIFDNGIQSMYKQLSHEPVWDTSEYKHHYQRVIETYMNEEKIIPWKDTGILDYLMIDLDYLDIYPGEIPWRTDIKQDESLYDTIIDKLKYERFIPWQAEEDFEDLNQFRGRTNLSDSRSQINTLNGNTLIHTTSFNTRNNQWFTINNNENELDTSFINEITGIDDLFDDSPIVRIV